MMSINIGDENLPESFVAEFGAKNGEWNLKLDVSKKETKAMKNTKVVNVNKKAQMKYPNGEEHNINVEKVSFMPFGNSITISEKFKPIENDDPERGVFAGMPKVFRDFAIFDDQGNSLDVIYNSTSTFPTEARNSFEFLKGNIKSKSLSIVPIQFRDPSADRVRFSPVLSEDKFPLELKLSDKGSCIVDKIEYGDTETKVYYRKKGVVANCSSYIDFVDENEKDVLDKFAVVSCHVVDREKGTYVETFPKMDPSKKYKIKYYTQEFDLLDQYKINIPLK